MPSSKQVPKIGFHSVKGGVGRTTAACMIGMRLAEKGFCVLLVDADFEAPTLDIMLRVNPELEIDDATSRSTGQSKSGIDHILKGFDGSWKSILKVQDLVVDVGKKWSEKDWRNKIQLSLPPGTSGSTLLTDLVDDTGAFGKNDKPGRLWVLPCSRDGRTNLSLNYSATEDVDSLDRGLRLAIDAAAERVKADVAIIDLRNGFSDAAALAGRHVHILITTFMLRYAHMLANINALRWYSETLRWDIPILNLYTLDKGITKQETKYSRFLKESYASGYRQGITKSEWFHKLDSLGIGCLSYIGRMNFSDFVAQGYPESDVEPITAGLTRAIGQLVTKGGSMEKSPLRILAR